MKHHHDGSITIHHQHHDGPHKDIEHAVPSLDHAHDSMQEHLGMPNPGEDMDHENKPMPGSPVAASVTTPVQGA